MNLHVILVQGCANLLCIVPILVYVLRKWASDDYSVTTNLYFLIPSPFSPTPQLPSHVVTVKMLSIYESFSVMLAHLFCLDSVVDSYVLIAIFVFIFFYPSS